MPDPDIRSDLTAIARTRTQVLETDRAIEALRVTRAELAAQREALLESGAVGRLQQVERRLDRIDADLSARRAGREDLLGSIGTISDRIAEAVSPERLVTTLDGRRPVAMLPVRLETRFESDTKLLVRVFPDQIHVDAHDPALTADEREGAQWYWTERWRAGLGDAETAAAAWRGLTSRFRPGRAAYLVEAMTPTNAPGTGDPDFPDPPARASTWNAAPVATALPDRFCVVGLAREGGQWVERFRKWADRHVPDRLPVGPAPTDLQAAREEGGLPVDEGTRWLREPGVAQELGALIEVEHPAVAGGIERLVVVGVDWTLTGEQAAQAVGDLLEAQRYSGHLGFVAQGTPTNNTSESRAGFSSSADAEAAALDPSAVPGPADEWSAGRRLAAALGLPPESFDRLPGATLREHAWASALTDVLWRATAGFYLTDLLDPLADDPQVDADLREFTRRNVFAGGPLPTLRVGAQPYGVLPVVSSRSFEPGGDRAVSLVHRVATLMRSIVTPALSGVPHLRRAGEDQDVDEVLLKLLQRTPVPWTFRFRALTGPVQRRNLSLRWDVVHAFQQSWTSAMWVGLGVSRSVRLNELTHGKTHPLHVPLVLKPGTDAPTSYLTEIADLMKDVHGRKALNLRENSVALLEALAACSAVLELDRCALQSVRDRLRLQPEAMATLPALARLAVRTPDTVRVQAPPAVAGPALDFRSGRQLADTVVPQLSSRPLAEYVTTGLADRLADVGVLIGAPTDPFHWLARNQLGLRTLAQAPTDQLDWAFRGYLDLFSTRLDAWFTGLATRRLAEQRAAQAEGVHLGCWGVVEDLRRDTGAAAESLGFVHAPSLAHAASTALLRNGRLANRGADGAVFDLQLTSDRVRSAKWLLEGVAQGQRLAALLGYRIERRLRESGLAMMRYQMPLRRTAPLRGSTVAPEESVEVLAARDVVDGVALLDRWRDDPGGVLAEVARQSGLAALPAADADRLRGVLDDVFAAYDAVSDVLIAESVHQAAVGNLDRSGAALQAHDRHGRAPEPDYVGSPRSGHTVAHRVGVVLQDARLPGWPQDARGAAEPMLNAWVGRLLGNPGEWGFAAVARSGEGVARTLLPVRLADLGLSPLAVALATQKPGQGRPSELEQRVALAFAAQVDGSPDTVLELAADPPPGDFRGGLAMLATLGEWVAKVAGAAPLTAHELVSAADLSQGLPSPGTVDVAEVASRVSATRARLAAVVTALGAASNANQRSRALLDAVPFDGPDAMPRVPRNHPAAATELPAQVAEVAERLRTLASAVDTALAAPVPDDEQQALGHQVSLLRSMLGPAQPVLPRWTLASPAAARTSLNGRGALLAGDPTAPASWLQRAALVRPELDGLAGLLLDSEAEGTDVAAQLSVVQLPHRPGAPWLALPFGAGGPPPHGSVGVVLHSWQPFEPARPFAGLLVDAWTETIPADTETTAITFHYDAPGARAPQAVLLAVHPAQRPGSWTFDLLLETVNEAVDLARLRTLSSAELAPMGSFLPALYLPDDYTHDVPSLSLRDLLLKAEASGFTKLYTDVLGKA